MKVMCVDGDWGIQNIKQLEYPDPTPDAEDIVIGIEAVSVNPRDRIMVEGGYGSIGGKLPLVPLCDGAGRVLSIGKNVRTLSIGDLVIPTYSRTWLTGLIGPESTRGAHGGPLDGTAQEMFVIPAVAAVRAPGHMSSAESATLTCAALTAWNALVEQGQVRVGQRIVLQGTGGVSIFALQIAKLHGLETIIISSSDEKLEKVAALGADHMINYKKTPEWSRLVLEITDGIGVDHILEIGGAGTLDQSIRAIKPSGTISLIGVLGGAGASLNLARIVTRNVRLQGVTVGSHEMLSRMVQAFELHEIRPVIDGTKYEIKQLGAALNALDKGRHFGKIVCLH